MQRKARKDQKVPELNVVEIFKDCHTSKTKGMTNLVKVAVVSVGNRSNFKKKA